jgi:hypothetical protein
MTDLPRNTAGLDMFERLLIDIEPAAAAILRETEFKTAFAVSVAAGARIRYPEYAEKMMAFAIAAIRTAYRNRPKP